MSGPLLTTARFELWRPQVGDLGGIFALTDDDETRRYLGSFTRDMGDSFARLHRNAGSWALHGYGVFMVRAKGEADIIATCGVFRSWRGLPRLDDVAEAGWIVRRDWWGKGVAGEVMTAAFDWFDAAHGSQRIACMIEDGNAGSERLAARFGFAEYDRNVGEDGKTVVLYERH